MKIEMMDVWTNKAAVNILDIASILMNIWTTSFFETVSVFGMASVFATASAFETPIVFAMASVFETPSDLTKIETANVYL